MSYYEVTSLCFHRLYSGDNTHDSIGQHNMKYEYFLGVFHLNKMFCSGEVVRILGGCCNWAHKK